jgi:hypothetical protein
MFDKGFSKKLSGILPRLQDSIPLSRTVILVFRKSMKMALLRPFSMPCNECRIASTPFLLDKYLNKLTTKGMLQKQSMSKLDTKPVLSAA